MKTLIIGCGVIGTIYGYALHKAGAPVTHYVRENKLKKYQDGIALQLLDGRQKKSGIQINDTYHPKMVSELTQNEDYDLVIISVNFYQLEDVLKLISGKFSKASILLFNNLWEGYEIIEKYLPSDKYLLGFPNAGGGYTQNVIPTLNGAILKSIRLGEKDGTVSERVKNISGLFGKANIKAEVEENMLHWLWVHFAINAGLNSAMVRAHGAKNFLAGSAHIKQGIINAKEALKVCQARNVQLQKFSDARTFSMPAGLLAIMFKMMMSSDRLSAKVLLEYKGAEELKRIYKSVVLAARQLNINIPQLESMMKDVERAEEYLL